MGLMYHPKASHRYSLKADQLREQMRILHECVPRIEEGDKLVDWQRAVEEVEAEIRASKVPDVTDKGSVMFKEAERQKKEDEDRLRKEIEVFCCAHA